MVKLFSPFGDQFSEKEFRRNLLESEKNRASILMIIFISLSVMYSLLMYIQVPAFSIIFGKRDLAIRLLFVLLFLAAYEAVLRLFFKQLISRKITPPLMMRYVNAFIETSIPAVLVLVVSESLNSFYVLHGPAPFGFFIFIILSVLRLDFYLCLFTGLLAAAEYAALAGYFTYMYTDPTGGFLSNSLNVLTKSLLLAISGLAAGFVTTQVKKRTLTSIKTMEEQIRVKNLFGQQVSQEVANELMSIKTEFAAQRKKVCVMFLDIRDFSLMVEDKDPEEIVKFQNVIFSFMAEIVSKNNGIINQFLGDGFLATFGAPLSFEHDCRNAVNAAAEILDEISRNSSDLVSGLKAGIGLHAGVVIAGNVGSPERKQYSVTGSVVILASRIEQLNKTYNTRMLISKEVYSELDNFKDNFELIGDVFVKGQEEPVTLYKFNG